MIINCYTQYWNTQQTKNKVYIDILLYEKLLYCACSGVNSTLLDQIVIVFLLSYP